MESELLFEDDNNYKRLISDLLICSIFISSKAFNFKLLKSKDDKNKAFLINRLLIFQLIRIKSFQINFSLWYTWQMLRIHFLRQINEYFCLKFKFKYKKECKNQNWKLKIKQV